MRHEYKARAEFSVFEAFDTGVFAAFEGIDPTMWESTDAQEVAIYATYCAQNGVEHYKAWHGFPGGWPRFLDMYKAAESEALKEAKGSHILFIPISAADEILREKE
jgi:hypothetical protein